jgi:hypothetical protein
MNKFYAILSVFFAIAVSACAEPEKKDVVAAVATGPTLASKLINAQLVRSWQRQSDAATLSILGGGGLALSMPECNVDGQIDSIDSYPQNQCLAGVATCGIIHLSVANTTSCRGFTPGTPGVCSYQTVAYQLVINCGGNVSDTQTFEWN